MTQFEHIHIAYPRYVLQSWLISIRVIFERRKNRTNLLQVWSCWAFVNVLLRSTTHLDGFSREFIIIVMKHLHADSVHYGTTAWQAETVRATEIDAEADRRTDGHAVSAAIMSCISTTGEGGRGKAARSMSAPIQLRLGRQPTEPDRPSIERCRVAICDVMATTATPAARHGG